jgi:HlyD family secretion protein
MKLKLPVLMTTALLLCLGSACNKDKSPVLNGRVEAYLTDLGPRVSGRLTVLNVKEGQRVKRGDLLARIAAEELDAAVNRDEAGFQSADAKRLELANGTRQEDIAQGEARVHDAEASLRLTDDTLRRAQKLVADKIVSQADLDKAQTERERAYANLVLQQKTLAELKAGARIEQRLGASAEARRAQATLDQTKVQASFTEIRAPFDGIVIHRLREIGSVLAAGQPIVTLARTDKLWVRVYLPQQVQATARLGMPVMVLMPDKRSLEATLDEVASEPEYTPKMVETREERVNLVYPARVNIPNGFDQGLLPGLAVDVKLKAVQ